MNTDDAQGEVPINRVKEVQVYANEFVQLYDDEVAFADGTRGRHLRARTPGAGPGVVVIPRRGGSLGLVRTFRYPIGAWEWALPRGFAHAADPVVSGRAELAEEMGLGADSVEVIGELFPNSGLLEDRCVVLLVEVAPGEGRPTDRVEVHGTRWLTMEQVAAEVRHGQIVDGFTVAALGLLWARARGKGGSG